MNWYYKTLGTHTHVRVFLNGANCGNLCFRNEEFLEIYNETEAFYTSVSQPRIQPLITFIEDGEDASAVSEATGLPTPICTCVNPWDEFDNPPNCPIHGK